jgi:hypothetical protein
MINTKTQNGVAILCFGITTIADQKKKSFSFVLEIVE